LRFTGVAKRAPRAHDSLRQRCLAATTDTPDCVFELVSGDHAVMIGDEIGKYVEHLRFRGDRFTVTQQLVLRGIQEELVESPRSR
jgi:hypothetical protein